MSELDPAEVFRQEAADLIETLEQALLDLEKRPDDSELVGLAFRALHTLKGSGAMFGFTAVSEFIHEFETAFDRVRKGEATADRRLIAAALEARDHVAQLIDDPDCDPERGTAILSALKAAVCEGAGVETGASEHLAAPIVETGSAQPVAAGWHVCFRLPADALILGTNPLLLLDELRSLGPCDVTADTSALPPIDFIEPQSCYLSWDVTLKAGVSREAVDDVFLFVRDDMELSIEAIASESPVAAAIMAPVIAETTTVIEAAQPMAAASEASAPKPKAAAASSDRANAAKSERNATLRVPAERLDELMDRVGELVIAQARLSQLAEAIHDPSLVNVAEEIERLTASLRDTTMGTRMVPIGTLFGRFRRLVHDLSEELGKPISFVTEGEDTELDKTVIEQLADPLVHLIRNSIDHGMEPPEKRAETGKAATGTLRLAASHRGAEVAITVSDDGAGLNAERIRRRAEEAGLLSVGQVISEGELNRMIFQPGFSTASEVTALSGRGVGMDVVKKTIDGLRGSIDVDTTPGKGTTVTLRLPLTLAIIDGLLVRVGEDRYTIPLAAVEECLELPTGVAADGRGRSFLNLRGDLVPFLKLRDLFHTEGEVDPYQKVVVVSSDNTRVGLVVDQIIGNNQTVIKQLSRLHSGVKTFSGATILGDGTVALILDVMHLVAYGQKLEERRRAETLGRAA
ncbi:two-component system, chemotaxis family, sensor kinase CheA [Fulvimarina manganoxydans]|uniref:Chemotaxis protein CheA n=1 Tax=Fulvimarina manganoxydans TaxID=937218 RepID=A0A1W2ETJ6_9HYPH|nr:chemotaxis protein CheA [Fulvimarina manganoxydans]SMD13034.1 two-component system, chemotaxis family, sensor kinase CheA [Fulvimarina manganoxydans]